MKTIRQQLTVWLLVSFGLLLVIGGVSVYFFVGSALLKEFDGTLLSKAMSITMLMDQSGGKGIDIYFEDKFMRGFDEGIETDFFEIWKEDGSVLKRSESLFQNELPCRYGELNHPKIWNLQLPNRFRGRAVGFRYTITNETKDRPIRFILVVVSDRRHLDQTLDTMAFVLGSCGVLVLAATSVVVPYVLRRKLRPIHQLSDYAASITVTSLSKRFPIENLPGELKPIGNCLNDLLERLEKAFERERQFSADLAHELRTPITELRSLAEISLKWPDTHSAESDREVLSIALQMQGIVTRLLDILRSERGHLVLKPEKVDLSALLEELWKPFIDKAKVKQLTITHQIDHGLKIKTDPILFSSILSNLLSNAVEYTPEKGMIRIEADSRSDRFSLRVINSVQNLTVEDLPRLFDRFWRKDVARTGTEHSGLGLSLGQSFAQTLGYQLAATLDGQGRLMLVLGGQTTLKN